MNTQQITVQREIINVLNAIKEASQSGKKKNFIMNFQKIPLQSYGSIIFWEKKVIK